MIGKNCNLSRFFPFLMTILVLFYSFYGHSYQMAKHAAEALGTKAVLKRVSETVPRDVLEKSGALEAQKQFEHVPICTVEELPDYTGFIIVSPTRFGNMAAQMRNFWDQTGGIWFQKKLVGKPVTAMTCTSSQGGGASTTLVSMYFTFLHHGMVVVGLPYEVEGLFLSLNLTTEMFDISQAQGGTPYGASSFTGTDGKRMPSAAELKMVEYQARHLCGIAEKLE
ncbi:hypothetical protein P9112_012498 [Eukaryota sp. TZLM1-RC]